MDLRVLAATNKDLKEEVMAGRFREDLHYRLNVIQLSLPPLRDRTEDIPLLAEHFLQQVAKKHGLGEKKLSPEAVRALTGQTWSGNVRALRNVLEQAAVMSEEITITAADLPFGPAPPPEGGILVAVSEDHQDLKAAIKEVTEQTERIIIRRTLEKTGGNRTHAADVLGISRRALINKIQAYGL